MTITKTTYLLRNAVTKEPIITLDNERDAVNLAGYLNKELNKEAGEVVKIVTTTEISEPLVTFSSPDVGRKNDWDFLEEVDAEEWEEID